MKVSKRASTRGAGLRPPFKMGVPALKHGGEKPSTGKTLGWTVVRRGGEFQLLGKNLVIYLSPSPPTFWALGVGEKFQRVVITKKDEGAK